MAKHNWIREDVVIDFPIPKSLQGIIEISEQMDLKTMGITMIVRYFIVETKLSFLLQ